MTAFLEFRKGRRGDPVAFYRPPAAQGFRLVLPRRGWTPALGWWEVRLTERGRISIADPIRGPLPSAVKANWPSSATARAIHTHEDRSGNLTLVFRSEEDRDAALESWRRIFHPSEEELAARRAAEKAEREARLAAERAANQRLREEFDRLFPEDLRNDPRVQVNGTWVRWGEKPWQEHRIPPAAGIPALVEKIREDLEGAE